MKELSALFSECLKKHQNSGPCDNNTCKLAFYCAVNNCEKGKCDRCLNHIQWAASPNFHYSCQKITYQYVLRFFNRFASEIAYAVASLKPEYLKGKSYLNVVSLGCGPGSEVYGFIKALRHKAPHIVLNYKGYDLTDVWNDVQQMSKKALSQTPHHIEFLNQNLFGAFGGFEEGGVEMLVLNYLLSDSQKYYNDTDKIKFIEEIAQFVMDHSISNILFNDMGYYGRGGLDSGVGMMLRLINALKQIGFNLSVSFRCFPSDKYIPSPSWKCYKQESLLFQPLPGNTFDSNIDCCKSKQIIVHIN